MIAIPAIVLIGWMAMLSMIAALILSRRWMRYVALGCAAIQVAAVMVLVLVAH